MSQITSFVKAVNVWVNVRVFVAIAVVAAKNAQAPTGSGSSTRPAMVEAKIDKSVHACSVTPTGMGSKNRIAKPIATEMRRGNGFAPGHVCVGTEGAAPALAVVAEATTLECTLLDGSGGFGNLWV